MQAWKQEYVIGIFFWFAELSLTTPFALSVTTKAVHNEFHALLSVQLSPLT
jgi:hypothetical protein